MLAIMAHLAHQALLAQRRNDAIGVHPADGAHALTGDGLVVGNDGKCLQRRLREAPLVPREHVGSNLVMEGRVREEAPPACDLAQLEASVGVGILSRELGKRRGHVARCRTRGLRQVRRGYGVVGHKEERLQKPLERVVLKPLQICHHASSPVPSCAMAAPSFEPRTSPKPSSSRSFSSTPCSSSS